MRLTTIDRYLGRRLVVTLVKALIALVAIFILIDLLTHRRAEIIKNDVPWAVVLRYYLLYVPWVAEKVAPLALLVSALLVLGDAAQNNEVTAALAGGVSLRRFARTPVLVALLFAAALFGAQETVGAPATRAVKDIERNYFSRSPDTRRGGLSWTRLDGEWTCHVFKFNRVALTGEGVMMHSIRDDALEHIEARRIYWDPAQGRWLLEDGYWAVFEPRGNARRSWQRITQRPAPFTETPDHLFAMTRPSEAMTARELSGIIGYVLERGAPVSRLAVDYHAKFSQPALVFVMIWLAVPFAMRLRRGGLAISFGASIVIALLYLVVFSISITLGGAGRLSPFVAAWLANAVFFAVGVTLFVKTPT